MATRPSTAKRNGAIDPALPQKKRARRRLIGAGALCLLAAVLLPAVFDSEPRQARDAIQVRIPSRDTPITEPVAPSASGTVQALGGSVAQPGVPEDSAASAAAQRADASPAAKPETPSAPKPEGAAAASAVAPKADGRPETPPVARPEPRPDARPDPKTKPDARPDPIAKLAETQAGKGGAFHLQVGAYASDKTATEQVERLRKAGQKAYTEKVRTAQGERIRVRAGPFTTREAAEKARAKLKAAGIDAALVAP